MGLLDESEDREQDFQDSAPWHSYSISMETISGDASWMDLMTNFYRAFLKSEYSLIQNTEQYPLKVQINLNSLPIHSLKNKNKNPSK